MVIGVDEVGRGCWAGPLVAAAVALKRPIRGLRDSKKLSATQREALDVIIRKRAVAFGIGWVAPAEIDALGLTAAVRLAMERAMADMPAEYADLVVDGHINYLAAHPRSRALIKADDKIAAVSAASIIAKVARDAFMRETAAVAHPGYGFERHVGYGTARHIQALQELGACELHRMSFAPLKVMQASSAA